MKSDISVQKKTILLSCRNDIFSSKMVEAITESSSIFSSVASILGFDYSNVDLDVENRWVF